MLGVFFSTLCSVHYLSHFVPLFIFRYCDPIEEALNLGVSSTGVITPAICPTGHYCLSGTVTKYEHPCSEGTFSNATGLSTQSQCTDCTSGSYCDTTGMFGKVIMFSCLEILLWVEILLA